MTTTTEPAPPRHRRDLLRRALTALVQKYLPEPFVLVIGLALLTGVLAAVVQGASPVAVVRAWGDGFWGLLSFTMQMALVLVLGYVVARAPIVERGIDALVGRVGRPSVAVALAALVGGVGSWVNWGFGLVIGGIVAGKLAARVRGVHHPLIIAAAYSGFTLYGLGLSASIPVSVSTPGHPLAAQMGVLPLSATIFDPRVLLLAAVVLVVLIAVNVVLHHRAGPVTPTPPATPADAPAAGADPDGTGPDDAGPDERTFAERLNHSRVPSILIGALGLLYLVLSLTAGRPFDINMINMALLFLGVTLLGTPAAFVATLATGVRTIGGIILLFPFYAGIMTIMSSTGLVQTMSSWFTAAATAGTLPLLGLLSSFVINFFVPSGGGHWVVQGPFMIDAARQLGSSIPANAMAVQIGNGWNDIIQPFWLLPALALSGLRLKDVMGYLVVNMLAVGVVYVAAVAVWGYSW